MIDPTPNTPPPVEVVPSPALRNQPRDEFIVDWIAYGMRELDAYMRVHAAFDRYCAERDG